MRYDIAFFLCCCRSFLSSSGRQDSNDSESYYDLLGVPPTAHADDIKRAYKRQSLLMHPDKLAQRGQYVTEVDRDRFTRMKHAYEVLSDTRRRETYDAIGERGMRWVEEPLSVDPQELAHNFATSSIYDRSKIFAIFLLVYVAVFILPVLICLMADGTLGSTVYWCAILVPLWIWDGVILFYHSRVILMGPISRPEHIPEEEWVDPLPMSRRISALIRFVFLVTFQIVLVLRLDGYIGFMPWIVVFTPLYVWDSMALRRKIMLACLVIVTPDELELAIGKRLCQCTPQEREEVGKRYVVVPPSSSSPARNAANRLISEARMDVVRILARMTFFIIVALNLDLGAQWNWWLIFLPIFGMSACIVGSALRNFALVKDEAGRSDPVAFAATYGGTSGGGEAADPSNSYSNMNNGGGVEEENAYDGKPLPLSDEEREELRAKVAQSAYRAGGTCLSQCFIVIMVCVLVGKIQGAGYSLLLVISPFLVAGGMVLCCLACTIFCISEVDENAGMVEFESAINLAAGGGGSGAKVSSTGGLADESYDPPIAKANGGEQLGEKENSHNATTGGSKPPPTSIWDPELGEIWQNATEEEEAEKEQQIKTMDTKLDEIKVVELVAPTTDVNVTGQRIEENPSTQSMSSSQCDLD